MPEFRILWTALPRSADATHLFVDVFVSPRLGTDTPGALLALSDFPTFLFDWPSQVATHLTFDVELDDGAATTSVAATRLPADAEGDLRSDAWLHLFPPATPVVGWKLADPTSRPIYSYPAAQVTAYLRDTYRHIGRRPSSDLPEEAVLEEVRRDLGDLIDTRVAAERARPSEEVTGGETTGGDTGRSPQGASRGA